MFEIKLLDCNDNYVLLLYKLFVHFTDFEEIVS